MPGAPSEAIRSHCAAAAPADSPSPPASARVSGPAKIWASHGHGQAGGDRDPGRLHTFGDRLGPVPGAEPAGGRPVVP